MAATVRLDYKITPIHVPKGSWDARPIDEIAPQGDEIVIPKTSSSVFVSTNIDYVLRNLGVRQLVIGGLLTDQCVESAVRDACDLGYLVTLVTDATATHTPERHAASLNAIRGYCRQRTADQVIAELSLASQPCRARISWLARMSPSGSLPGLVASVMISSTVRPW